MGFVGCILCGWWITINSVGSSFILCIVVIYWLFTFAASVWCVSVRLRLVWLYCLLLIVFLFACCLVAVIACVVTLDLVF